MTSRTQLIHIINGTDCLHIIEYGWNAALSRTHCGNQGYSRTVHLPLTDFWLLGAKLLLSSYDYSSQVGGGGKLLKPVYTHTNTEEASFSVLFGVLLPCCAKTHAPTH